MLVGIVNKSIMCHGTKKDFYRRSYEASVLYIVQDQVSSNQSQEGRPGVGNPRHACHHWHMAA